jgi:hypothetical protein
VETNRREGINRVEVNPKSDTQADPRATPRPLQPGQPGQATQPGQIAAGQQGGLDFVSIKRQIAQECLKNAREKWESKDRADCEMSFIGAQIVKHQSMIDSGKVLQRHVSSPELQQLIAQGVETAQAHQKEAEELIEKLSKDDTAKRD